MNVLILGSGGREHAFALKLSESPKINQLFVAPGNAGTHKIATNIDVNPTDFKSVKKVVLDYNIEMVVVGPEAPLVEGVHDFFLLDDALKDISVIGPKKDGALLEGSKDFSKQFMQKHGVPTACYKSFTKHNLTEGITFLETLEPPYVLKADGLAAGKGVLILQDLAEAKKELRSMIIDKKFGKSSSKVVIEEFLEGIELSCFVLTDGHSYKTLPFAKDYKKIGEGDTGLNTGGMGAISPVPFLDDDFLLKVENKIIKPTIDGIKNEKMEYIGFVFIGLIKVNEEPYVIEYNVRMGDPETEVVFPRISTDVIDLFDSLGTPKFNQLALKINPKHAVTVILVSGGYPEEYEKEKVITGLSDVKESFVFHAGTKQEENNFVTNGGRVLAVTSISDKYQQALKLSYAQIQKLGFEKMYYRKDIGFDL